MRQIQIFDSTLQGDAQLSFKNRLKLAQALDQLGVDYIGIASPQRGAEAAQLARTLGQILRHAALAVPVGLDVDEAEQAAQVLRGAHKPVITVSVPVSPSGLEYQSGVRPEQLASKLEAQVALCRSLGPQVCFEAKDATRAAPEFLCTLIHAAVRGGASLVLLCDSEGRRLPWEMEELLRQPLDCCPAPVFVSCSDALHLATAGALSALCAGAVGVQTSLDGKNGAKLSSLAAVLRERGASLELSSGLDMTVLELTVERAKSALGSGKRGLGSFDGGSGSITGLTLHAGANLATVSQAVSQLGYTLSSAELDSVYESVCHIAAKKDVDARELEAIVANAALQVPPTYKLESYVIHCGNVVSAVADIRLLKNGVSLRGLAPGDGPVDAAFLALEQITGHHYELDDFQISAVTEGQEAMGSAFLRLRGQDKLYSGSGLSTDVIGACIYAYVAALNKIAYEEQSP